MVAVTILYPNNPGSRFDFEYYLRTHMPMSLELLGPAIKSVRIERGAEGQEKGSLPTFVALCHFVCESREAFETAFWPNAAVLRNDMPRYTDIEPVIQISEIVLQR
jgi:uncharacterized protein (TIGR02118 family)